MPGYGQGVGQLAKPLRKFVGIFCGAGVSPALCSRDGRTTIIRIRACTNIISAI
jgi:hypothetical protein